MNHYPDLLWIGSPQDLLRVSLVDWADQGPLDFHAVAFDVVADVATLPPSTKSLQVGIPWVFPGFFWFEKRGTTYDIYDMESRISDGFGGFQG